MFGLIGRLSARRLNLDRPIMLAIMHRLELIRLHLEYQIAVLDVSLGGSEGCAVCIKGSIVRLVPPVSVKGVEAIPPVEVERFRRVVVRVRLHIVVHNIPGHILGI